MEINTHNLKINFGKHSGELWTRLPVSYLRFIINEFRVDDLNVKIALSELERRGTNLDIKVDISGHAIDRASLNCRRFWHETALNKHEGLYSWLLRTSQEAIEKNEREDGVNSKDRFRYQGLKYVFKFGNFYPTLKTIMPQKIK